VAGGGLMVEQIPDKARHGSPGQDGLDGETAAVVGAAEVREGARGQVAHGEGGGGEFQGVGRGEG